MGKSHKQAVHELLEMFDTISDDGNSIQDDNKIF